MYKKNLSDNWNGILLKMKLKIGLFGVLVFLTVFQSNALTMEQLKEGSKLMKMACIGMTKVKPGMALDESILGNFNKKTDFRIIG